MMENLNPFKSLESTHEVPDDMKNKVMSSIASAKLIMDLTSLFTSNYTEALSSLFTTENSSDDEENNEKD